MTDDGISLVARALAHPTRIQIIRLLASQTECRGAEVFSEIPAAQSTVSEHLKILKEAGLIVAHRTGSSMVYCLAYAGLEEFSGAVAEISASIHDCVPGKGEC